MFKKSFEHVKIEEWKCPVCICHTEYEIKSQQLNHLSNKEFEDKFQIAIKLSSEKGKIIDALEKTCQTGIKCGTEKDFNTWFAKLQVDSANHSPETSALLSLNDEKQSIISRTLSQFICDFPQYFIEYDFNDIFHALPAIYNELKKM
ncbi:uncharacterized protein LOC144746110 [Ciona intestinalis]